MKTNTTPRLNTITRRGFLEGISVSGLMLASPLAMARENAVAALRKLAGGKPLIGTAVASHFEKNYTPEEIYLLATHFDSVTPENCMKWTQMCSEEGAYRFEEIDRLIAFVRKLRDKGCRIDVVGNQSHLEIGEKTGANLDNMIKQFAAEGFRCALTEVDVDVIPRNLYWNPKTREDAAKINPYVNGCPPEILEKQAKTYREAMGAVMTNIKHVDRVTFWGFGDGRSWLNSWPWKRVNHGLLFDRDSKPKLSFHAIAEMLKKGG
jgi:GH35 family endo-1,4-beta-xylanase